jgi:hypothetical protein
VSLTYNHAQKQNLFSGITIEYAIPAFHARAHGPKCLRLLHPSKVVGCGTVDGEASERKWSLLGRKSHLVKYMSKASRSELLEDTILFVARRGLQGLLKRMELKTIKLYADQPSLKAKWTSCSVSEGLLGSWMSIERYHLNQHVVSRSPLQKLDDNIRGHVLRFYDIHTHRTLESSLPEGTKTQTMIADKVAGVLNALQTLIEQRTLKHPLELPSLSLVGALDVRSPFWSKGLPLLQHQRDAIDAFSNWKRCEEELLYLQGDMASFKSRIYTVVSQLDCFDAESTNMQLSDLGKRGLMVQKGLIRKELMTMISRT